jgi:hypothetical protein
VSAARDQLLSEIERYAVRTRLDVSKLRPSHKQRSALKNVDQVLKLVRSELDEEAES